MNKPAGTSTPTKPAVTWRRSPNFSSRNGVTIKRIILHYTTGPTAEGALSWFENPASQVSAHYVIDKDGDIYQCVRDADKAWHAYGENADSIGIEHVARKGDRLTPAQSNASANLLRWLLAEYHLAPTSITAHRFTTSNKGRTDCPGDLWRDEKELREWVRANVVPPAKGDEPVPEEPKGTGRPYQPCPVPVPWKVTLAREGSLDNPYSYFSQGGEVYDLQCALIGLGYLAKPKEGDLVGDVFNEHVEWAVMRLQLARGLAQDGIVGPKTRAEIEELLTAARKPQPTEPKADPRDPSVATLRPVRGQWHQGAWAGLRVLNLGIGADTFRVASGARGAQNLRRPSDPRSVPGNLEPIPQGRYRIGDISWASGKDSYEGSHGAGLGPVWIPLDAEFSDDRGAFGFHLDSNIGTSPGSAGCVVFRDVPDLKRFVAALRKHDPKILAVEYGL